MSADPKSLATLAITSAKIRNDISNGSVDPQLAQDDPSGQPESTNQPSCGPVIHKFRSTDEFIAGWTAAFINTTALFPINKLIFRQMAGGHGAQKAADQMKEEGLRYLYRGILPPLIQKMSSVSIMFGSFGHYKKWADQNLDVMPPLVNLALAAFLTGATEAVLTPLERVQMLLQDRSYHKDYKNTLDALIKIRRFGSAEYYRGLTCVLLRNGPSNMLFFGLRDEIKKFMPGRQKAGHQRNSTAYSENQPNTSQSSLASKQAMENSLTSYLGSRQGRTAVGPDSNQQTYRPQHDHSHQQPREKDSMLHDFLSGAILGMCISTLFYPLSVVRTRMQTRAPGTEFLSMRKAFNAVYSERDRKFSRLFHGCLINVMRQFVSWGIINCSYELVLDLLHKMD